MSDSLRSAFSVFCMGLMMLLGGGSVSSCTNPSESTRNKSSKLSIFNVFKRQTGSVSFDSPPRYTYRIVNAYPHDPNAFTQGLAFEEGLLYEGTGLAGKSTLRKVDLETGHILRMHKLPSQIFGEGVTIYRSKLIQLSLRSHVGFIYDKESFALLGEFNYSTEGWGITYDGRRLIMSDGSAILRFLDPETLVEIGKIEVYDRNKPVTRLNELEYVRGEIYANVWRTDHIARISPQTGQVLGWIDLKGLMRGEKQNGQAGVLNGIAYDPKHDRLFVTGKLWPKVFEVELIPAED